MLSEPENKSRWKCNTEKMRSFVNFEKKCECFCSTMSNLFVKRTKNYLTISMNKFRKVQKLKCVKNIKYRKKTIPNQFVKLLFIREGNGGLVCSKY